MTTPLEDQTTELQHENRRAWWIFGAGYGAVMVIAAGCLAWLLA